MSESFKPRDDEEVHPDTEHSLVGQTTDSDWDRQFGTEECWTCGYRGSPAEIKACEKNGAGCIR